VHVVVAIVFDVLMVIMFVIVAMIVFATVFHGASLNIVQQKGSLKQGTF